MSPKAGRFLIKILRILIKVIAPLGAMALGFFLLRQEFLVAGLVSFSIVGVGLYELSSVKSTKGIRDAAQLLGCFIVGMVIGSGLLPKSIGYPLTIIGIVPWQRKGRLVQFIGVAIPLTGLSMPLLEDIMPDTFEANVLQAVWMLAGFFTLAALMGKLDRKKDRESELLAKDVSSVLSQLEEHVRQAQELSMKLIVTEERKPQENREESL